MHLLIVTGFLGAGKTTLLGQALSGGQLGRAALLVNEFGSVDIDGALLEGAGPAPGGTAGAPMPLLRLPNGCVCCQVQDDFLDAVRGLCERVSAGELALERIVLETSGLADPAPLLARVLGSRSLRERFEAVHALAVVDGVAGAAALERHVEARHQVACADLLLLSKVDLIDAGEVAAWRRRLRAANPQVDVVTMREGVPDDARWLQTMMAAPPLPAGGGARSHHEHRHEHEGGHEHGHGPAHAHAHAHDHDPAHPHAAGAHHSPGLESFHLRCGALPSREHLQEWLSTLLLLHAERLLRLKGFVALEGVEEPLLLQGALDGVRLMPAPGRRAVTTASLACSEAGSEPGTELVAIARGMEDPRQRDSLRRALQAIAPGARL